MSRLLVLHSQDTVRVRIRAMAALADASGEHHDVCHLARWDDLPTVRRRIGGDVAIVDPYWSGELDVGHLKKAARECPALPLVAYPDFSSRPASHVRILCDAGVEHFVSIGFDDHPAQLLEVVTAASCATACSQLLAGILTRLPEGAAALLHIAYPLSASRRARVDDLARAEGVDVRTLQRQCERLRLPAPQRLIGWCRILRIATMLRDRARSAAGISFTLGFADAAEMRRYVKRFTGLTPSSLRNGAALAAVVALMSAELEGQGLVVTRPL